MIADKCNVPLLYRFELAGTSLDVERVLEGLERFWEAAAEAEAGNPAGRRFPMRMWLPDRCHRLTDATA